MIYWIAASLNAIFIYPPLSLIILILSGVCLFNFQFKTSVFLMFLMQNISFIRNKICSTEYSCLSEWDVLFKPNWTFASWMISNVKILLQLHKNLYFWCQMTTFNVDESMDLKIHNYVSYYIWKMIWTVFKCTWQMKH